MKSVRVSVPIPFCARISGRLVRSLSAGWINVKVLAEDEAPVAIRWDEGPDKQREFRTFEGRLYQRVRDMHYAAARAEEVFYPGAQEDPGVWKTVSRTQGTWLLTMRHPFHSPHFQNGPAGRVTYPDYYDDASEHPMFVQHLATARENAAAMFVADGYVWQPSLGPRIQLFPGRNDEIQLNWTHPDRDRADTYSFMSNFAADEIELADELTRHFHHVAPVVRGNAPVFLIKDGYYLERSNMAAECAAWMCLWEARQRLLVANDRRTIEAVVRLRRQLDARWAHLDTPLDHFLTGHRSNLSHVPKNGIVPDPVAIIPMVEEFLAEAGHAIRYKWTRGLIDMTLERIRRQHGVANEQDLEALSF